MKYQDICSKILKIQAALQDEESKLLMDARLNYSITRNNREFYQVIDSLMNDWHCSELEQFMARKTGKGIIIWGCGCQGLETKRVIDLYQYPINYFCDSDPKKIGTVIDGIPVISVDLLFEKYSDYSVVIGSGIYKDKMMNALLSHGFSNENILYPSYFHLQAQSGKKQYFDVFKPEKNEIFMDVGAFDGSTTLEFIQWTKETYQKVILLEPLHEMCDYIDKICKEKKLQGIDIKEAAAWNKKEKIFFKEDKAGSRVEDFSEIAVDGIDIDSLINNEKVTFIKMDIEGSELKALEGAKNVIQRERPKLAISLYHKPEDIIELPSYILELVPEYKFYIRHYTSDLCETVLYAIV